MKGLILLIAGLTAIATVTHGQDAKTKLRDFTPKYSIDTFSIDGEASYLKRRVVLFQKVAGVRSAYWDDVSNILTVQYDRKLVQMPAIKKFFFGSQPSTKFEEEQNQNTNLVFVCCLNKIYSITSKRKK